MPADEKLLVKNCPYCEYIKNLPEDVKLYYPSDRKSIHNCEFIIIECKECSNPLVIYGEHLSELTKESYGRILYKCKMLFGSTIKVGNKHKIVRDHWCLHRLGVF